MCVSVLGDLIIQLIWLCAVAPSSEDIHQALIATLNDVGRGSASRSCIGIHQYLVREIVDTVTMGAATLVKSRSPKPSKQQSCLTFAVSMLTHHQLQTLFVPAATTGSPHTFANKQAAVVQDLARRQTSCPAHPAHQSPASFGSSAQRDAAANLESTFARPSFDPAKKLFLQTSPSIDCSEELTAAIQYTVQAGGSWADFCVKHDVTCVQTPQRLSKRNGTAARLQARCSQLQVAFSDMNIAAAIAKDSLLLTYSLTTLKQHMDLLQALVGKDKASAMIAKMPALLHLKPSTISCKLDDLYDLLPNADVDKVHPCLLHFV